MTTSRYQEVLMLFDTGHPMTTLQKSFAHLVNEATDDQLVLRLRAALNDVNTVIGRVPPKKAAQNFLLAEATFPSIVELGRYCRAARALEKPEWEIMAIRNGWTPPA